MSTTDLIFILTVGRSGSSALARALSLCGCALPRQVFGPDEANPKGFWEPAEAAKLNIDFLLSQHWGTSDPVSLVHGKIECSKSHKDDYIGRLRAFLSRCPTDRPLVIKEPLISEVMEFWFQAAREESFDVKAIVLFRNPREVVESTARLQPGTELALTQLETIGMRWLRTNLLIERCTRKLPRIFIDHAKLMSDWRTEVTRISKALAVSLQLNEPAVDAFLARDINRQRPTCAAVGTSTDHWTTRLYEIFSTAAGDEYVDVTDLNAIYDAYAASPVVLNEFATRATSLEPLRMYFQTRPIWQQGVDY